MTATEVQVRPAEREVVYRHSLAVRLTHWINLLCLTLLLMSGLALFNVHPQLYRGHYGYPGVPTVLSITGSLRSRDATAGRHHAHRRLCDRHHRHPRRDL